MITPGPAAGPGHDGSPTGVDISSVEWETPPPAAVGSRIAFVAHFLGRRIAYTWEPVPEGTGMTLRNAGRPSGFGALTAPLLARAMRRADEKDLAAPAEPGRG